MDIYDKVCGQAQEEIAGGSLKVKAEQATSCLRHDAKIYDDRGKVIYLFTLFDRNISYKKILILMKLYENQGYSVFSIICNMMNYLLIYRE